jgi:hypothetical protein
MKTTITKSRQHHIIKPFLLQAIFTLLFSCFSFMITYAGIIKRGSTRTATTSNSNLLIYKPSGVLPGDVLIINLAYEGANSPSLSGWTVVSQKSLGTGRYGAVLYKIAQSNEPSYYIFSLGTGGDNGVGALMAFAGVDITGNNPFDVAPGTINTANSNIATATAITTVSAGAAVIMLTQEVGSGRSWSNWSAANLGTLTEIADTRKSGDASVGTAWKISSSASNTGNGTATLSGSQQNGAILIALKPGAVNYFVRTDAGANLALQNTSSWTDSETGVGGNSPTNFTNANQLFNIGYNDITTHSISGNWTVSGSGSKIFIGDGETASTFEVGSSYVLTAAVDVEPLANFILSTTGSLNGISFEALENNSTVSYTANSGTQIVKPATYSNLTLSGAGLKNAGGHITVNGTLYLGDNPNNERGQLEMTISYTNYADVHDVNSTSLYNDLNSYVLTMGPSAITTGTGDVTGKIRRTNITSGTTYTFGNINTQLTFNNTGGGDLPTQITVVATFGEQGLHVEKANAVKRMYQVLRTGGTNPTRMIIRLAYLDNELNSNAEPSLVLWDHHLPYGGITPHEHGKTNQSTASNWVELSNHYVQYLAPEGSTTFTKYWMISGKLSTSIVWLGASSTAWDNPTNWNIGSVPLSTDKVIIPDAATTARDPELEGSITVGAIDIQPGAIVNGGSATLTLTSGPAYNGGAGTWVNNGTFNAGSSTIVIDYDSATIAGNTNFYNLTINTNKKATIQDNSTIDISGSIINNGIFDAAYAENTFIYSGTNQTIINPNGGMEGYHNLQINGTGAIFPATLNIAGNLVNNGTVDAITNNSTVILYNAGQQNNHSIGGTTSITYYNLVINNGLEVALAGVNAAVTNNLTLTEGIFDLGTQTLTLGGNLDRSNGSIDAGSGTFAVNGSAAQTIPDGCFNGMINFLYLNKSSNTLTLSGSLQVNDLYLKGGSLNIDDNVLTIHGALTRTAGIINAASGEVIMNGAAAQTIPAGALGATSRILNIHNAAGVTLSESKTVEQLDLEEGIISIGNNNITTGTISGGSAASYIRTEGSGVLKATVNNGEAVTFPVGNTTYNPVTITNNSGAADDFDVRILDEVYNGGPTGVPLASYARVKRTWMINKATANNGAGIDFSFEWNAGDVDGSIVTPKLFHYDNAQGRWMKQTGSYTYPNSTSLVYTGYTGSFSPFAVVDEQFTLPVTWLSFTAKKTEAAVLLEWKTASEQNSLDFLVQHSINGFSWTTIGNKNAGGFTSTISTYQFTHQTPASGNNYYRIVQRDADGKYSYSNVLQLHFDNNSNNLQILGNPVSNGILLVQIGQDDYLGVYTNDGRLLEQKLYAAGLHSIQVSQYSKGVYYLKSSTTTVRFIIQ